MEEKEKELENFIDLRKKIETLYDSEESLKSYRRKSISSSSSLYTEDTLNAIIADAGNSLINYDRLINLSKFAYSTEPVFAEIIDYYANMFVWKYIYYPIKVRDTASSDEYENAYATMTDVIEGIKIENIYPVLLTKMLLEGSVFFMTEKHTPSKTVNTFILNRKYCKPVLKTQYGTGVFSFDLKYFDDLALSESEKEMVFNSFPKDLIEAYANYKFGKVSRYFIVDGRYGTYVSLNDNNFPTKLSLLKSLLDYDKYRENEVSRNEEELTKLVSHEIPNSDNQLLFELDEVKALHSTMAKQLSGNKRLKLVTTFGKLDVHPLQEPGSVKNEVLSTAHKAIYESAGLNTNIFTADSKEALEYSITKDQSFMWKYIEQITNFYNLTINNLYNFKGYQLEFSLLPITHYNYPHMLELYRKNGEYGVGILELVVVSGTKQSKIAAKAQIEDHLNLHEILKPLSSSHTTSNTEESSKKEDEITENEELDSKK